MGGDQNDFMQGIGNNSMGGNDIFMNGSANSFMNGSVNNFADGTEDNFMASSANNSVCNSVNFAMRSNENPFMGSNNDDDFMNDSMYDTTQRLSRASANDLLAPELQPDTHLTAPTDEFRMAPATNPTMPDTAVAPDNDEEDTPEWLRMLRLWSRDGKHAG